MMSHQGVTPVQIKPNAIMFCSFLANMSENICKTSNTYTYEKEEGMKNPFGKIYCVKIKKFLNHWEHLKLRVCALPHPTPLDLGHSLNYYKIH